MKRLVLVAAICFGLALSPSSTFAAGSSALKPNASSSGPSKSAVKKKPRRDHAPSRRPGKRPGPGTRDPDRGDSTQSPSSSGESSGGSGTSPSANNSSSGGGGAATRPPRKTPPQGTSERAQSDTPRDRDDRGAAALRDYKGRNYAPMNALLRNKLLMTSSGLQVEGQVRNYGDSEPEAQQQTYEALRDGVANLLDYMSRAPKYSGEKPLFRGVALPPDQLKKLRELGAGAEGDWEDSGFFSTAQAESPHSWVKESEFRNRDTIIQIVLPKNSSGNLVAHSGVDIESGDADRVAGQYRENEVLFPPGQRFRVRKVIEGNDKVRDHIKTLINEDPNKQQATAAEPDPYRLNAVKAKTYIVVEALPYTAKDRERVDKRIAALKPRNESKFTPPQQPPSRHQGK